MRDVAARAGVSAKTVSRVFNDDPHVLPHTRERVQQAMRDLNYVPNVLATTFRAGRSSVIGVAVPDIVDPFFAAIARAVDAVARGAGMSTLVASLGEDPADERATLESLLGRKLSGLIVAPVSDDQGYLERWQDSTPIVCVDRGPTDLRTDTFTADDEGGAFAATAHLLGHGHRRIAYLGDALHRSTEQARIAGWRRALQQAGVTVDEDLVGAGVATAADAQRAVGRVRGLADPATAIFSANARTTMALARALRESPLPLVGFGDFPLADLLRPAITVIDQNPERMGRLAAERVLSRLAAPRAEAAPAVVDVTLVERDSCRIPA
jgi:LacI family transcriptional regulator